MESFLADYTKNVDSRCSYESKATFVASFESLRKMFIILDCLPVPVKEFDSGAA